MHHTRATVARKGSSVTLSLYLRFTLSLRDVEELLAARGIVVTYETVRQWAVKFGQAFANEVRRRQPRQGDKCRLDEVFITVDGKRHYLWRAVDQEGYVLDILVQSRRHKHAAKRFFRKLRTGLQYVPRVIVTDKLRSYGAARKEILPSVEHRHLVYQLPKLLLLALHFLGQPLNDPEQYLHQRGALRFGDRWQFKSLRHTYRLTLLRAADTQLARTY
jgi:hypothetical protein